MAYFYSGFGARAPSSGMVDMSQTRPYQQTVDEREIIVGGRQPSPPFDPNPKTYQEWVHANMLWMEHGGPSSGWQQPTKPTSRGFDPNPKTLSEYRVAYNLWLAQGGASSPWPPPVKPAVEVPVSRQPTSRGFDPNPKTLAEYKVAYNLWLAQGGASSPWPPPVKPAVEAPVSRQPAARTGRVSVDMGTGKPSAEGVRTRTSTFQTGGGDGDAGAGGCPLTVAEQIEICEVEMGGKYSPGMPCGKCLMPDNGGNGDTPKKVGVGTAAVVGAAALAALLLLKR